MEIITGFIDFLRKIPTAFLVAIAFVLALILFLPESMAEKVAVDIFRKEYRKFIGPTFLLSLAYLVARFYLFFSRYLSVRKAKKVRISYLETLTAEEKGYLKSYIVDGANSLMCGPDDGIMAGLVANGITYRATSIGDMLDGFAFNMHPWARKYLENNINLLDGAAGRHMTPREKRYLDIGW